MLKRKSEKSDTHSNVSSDFFLVPRSRCLIFETSGRLHVSPHNIIHGVAEIRFITTLKKFIDNHWRNYRSPTLSRDETPRSSQN